MICRLSTEILDKILENLDGSKRDIAACSVVCKSWLPACRYRLFAEVKYRPDLARHILQHTHATTDAILPCIRRVIVRGPIAENDGEKHILADSIFRLPRLTDLRVDKLNWSSLCPLVHRMPKLPSLHQLLKLSLQYVHLPSFSLLAASFDFFPALEELSLDNVSWDTIGNISVEDTPDTGTTERRSSLRKLRVAFCHNRVLLNWLHYGVISDGIQPPDSRAQRSFPQLSAVSLPDVMPEEEDILGVFLASLGESLEFLDFGIVVHEFNGRHNDEFLNLVSLSNNTQLKALGIHQVTLFQFPFHPATDPPSPIQPSSDMVMPQTPYAWIISLLSTLGSAMITSITLHIWLSAESQLDLLSWPDLTSVLARINPKQVRFQISGIGRNTEGVEGWIRGRLPDLGSAGPTLQFEFTG